MEKRDGCRNIGGYFQLILMNPPYNIRRERGCPHSSHDKLSEYSMKAVVDICSVLLRPGGHVICFCSAVKFATWARFFGEKTVQVSTKKKRKKAFIVDTHDVKFLNKPGV